MPPSTKSKRLGKLIQQRRTSAGLSLRELAGQTNTDAPYLLRLERGEYRQPSMPILEALSRALEIPIADLQALAGYRVASQLPAFEPYLRATTELPENAIDELQKYFDMLSERYGTKRTKQSGGRRGRNSL
jgi:transcriptional regulator with XRE-family HTH domain